MPLQKRITILDVAKEAGVSAGTVSRVLNQRDGEIKISEITQERVRDAARSLGYQRNPFASALRTERTGIIGAITRDISAIFLSIVARELQRAAHEHGIELLIGHAEYHPEVIDRQLDLMRSYWFDGLILLGDLPDYQSVMRNLEQNDKPFVSIACGPHIPPPFVNVDEEAGVTLAMDYLRSLGHVRIAFIGNETRAGVRDRAVFFQQYVKNYHLVWRDEYLQFSAITRGDAMDKATRLLQLPEPPTAIFCATDIQAFGAMNRVWQMGLRVPDDISIIGFDNVNGTEHTYPPLTTVAQPAQEIAREGLALLMSQLDGDMADTLKKQVILQPQLVVRQSCARPRLERG